MDSFFIKTNVRSQSTEEESNAWCVCVCEGEGGGGGGAEGGALREISVFPGPFVEFFSIRRNEFG